VSVFGKLASENGSEAPFFIVLRVVALISQELVTSAPAITRNEELSCSVLGAVFKSAMIF
jgi:hypothetical protein